MKSQQTRLHSPNNLTFVEIWYDENRNKTNPYEDRDWFLQKIFYPTIEPTLRSLGKTLNLNIFSFKNKKDVETYGCYAVKEFYNFRAPDILLVIDNNPVILLETSDAVPTGNQPGKKIPILLKSSELKIPSIFYLPLLRVRFRPHQSNAFCDLSICRFALNQSKKTKVPTHLFFSERYTDTPLKSKYLTEVDIKMIKTFVKSDDYLQNYIRERILLFFNGELLRFTKMDFELMQIVRDYCIWSEKRLKGRKIILENKIIFRQDPDRGWSERGTGCLEAVESQVIELKSRVGGEVEAWFPNIGKNFWYFQKRQSIRIKVLKKYATLKFQEDLTKKDFELIKDLLKEHHSGKRKRASIYLNDKSVYGRLSKAIVIFSNPEDWLNGIPEEFTKLPQGAKIVLPRLVKDFYFFREETWKKFIKTKSLAIFYQDDLLESEFKLLEEHFK